MTSLEANISHADAAAFRSVFLNSPNAYVLLDTKLAIVDCNWVYEQRAGLPRSRLIGRDFFSVFPEASKEQQALRESMQRAINTRETRTIPMLRYPMASVRQDETEANGALQERYWTIVNIPLLDEAGRVQYLLNHSTDITDLTQLQQHALERKEETHVSNSDAALSMEGLHNLGTAHDASLMKMQNLLMAERRRMQSLFQQAPGFICVLRGPNHVYEVANDAYYQLIGHRDIIGHELAKVLPEVIEQGFLDKLDKVFATGEVFIGRALPIQLQRKQDDPLTQCYIDLIYQPIRDDSGQVSGIFVQGHDVTEAYLLAREVSFQAAHDPLTGLYNRREFARLTEALVGPSPGLGADEQTAAREKPHALLYLDLDQFKIVNDRCGHAAGDELLCQVASLLAQHVRDTDILARMGGDEFAIVLRHCDINHAMEQAERLRVAVNNLVFIWEQQRYGISISVGLVLLDPATSAQFNEALSMADAACFLAKEKGRNRVQLYQPSDAELIQQQRDMDWAARLKDCMEKDRVKLYAQRMVCLQPDGDTTIQRCEILARLLDEDGRLVPPSAFIPAAERYGLMPALDRHIIHKVFKYLCALPDERRRRSLYFINVSGVTLGDSALADDIERMVSSLPGLDPRTVCFEITETAALLNLSASQAAMQRLIELGFQFALDDFGSGMSSFAYLRKLPVQYLKIDGEFIAHIQGDPVSRVMVESIAKVARAMKIATVGEFVESVQLAEILTELGINYGQGYGLHVPEPVENLERIG